jgi:hypothetical protein
MIVLCLSLLLNLYMIIGVLLDLIPPNLLGVG